MHSKAVLILCMITSSIVCVVRPMFGKTSQLGISARWLSIATLSRRWYLMWPTAQFDVIDAVADSGTRDIRFGYGRISLRMT